MLLQSEHFLFFPVVVLLAVILIVLSFRFIFKLLVLFLIILAIWYGLYYMGITSSFPIERLKPEHKQHQEQAAYVQL